MTLMLLLTSFKRKQTLTFCVLRERLNYEQHVLHVLGTLATRAADENFLASKGYSIQAPVVAVKDFVHLNRAPILLKTKGRNVDL